MDNPWVLRLTRQPTTTTPGKLALHLCQDVLWEQKARPAPDSRNNDSYRDAFLANNDDDTRQAKHRQNLKHDNGHTFDASGGISQYSTADTLPRLALGPKAGWQTFYGNAK